MQCRLLGRAGGESSERVPHAPLPGAYRGDGSAAKRRLPVVALRALPPRFRPRRRQQNRARPIRDTGAGRARRLEDRPPFGDRETYAVHAGPRGGAIGDGSAPPCAQGAPVARFCVGRTTAGKTQPPDVAAFAEGRRSGAEAEKQCRLPINPVCTLFVCFLCLVAGKSPNAHKSGKAHLPGTCEIEQEPVE